MTKKYIDAEKLKAEIERHIKDVKDAEKRFTPNMGFFDAKLSGIYDVLAIIDSLQQEQPEEICSKCVYHKKDDGYCYYPHGGMKRRINENGVYECTAFWEREQEKPKRKEQPQEELVYRLNGLMQEYIKEGEDDAEKEHRLKCYQLFWDALEDADFFEQKEQEPVEWSEEDEKMRNALLNLLHLHYAQDNAQTLVGIEAGKFRSWLKSLSPQPKDKQKPEWSEEDEAMRDNILCVLSCFFGTSECDSNPSLSTLYPAYQKEKDWLKSLKERMKGE